MQAISGAPRSMMWMAGHRGRNLTRIVSKSRRRRCVTLHWVLFVQSCSFWFCGTAERPISPSHEKDVNATDRVALQLEGDTGFASWSQSRWLPRRREALLQVDGPSLDDSSSSSPTQEQSEPSTSSKYLEAVIPTITGWYNELQKRTDLNYKTQQQWIESVKAVGHMLDQFQFKAWRLQNNMTRWTDSKEQDRMKSLNQDAFIKVLEDAKENQQWKESEDGRAAAEVVKDWNSDTGAYVRPAEPLAAQPANDREQLRSSLENEGTLRDEMQAMNMQAMIRQLTEQQDRKRHREQMADVMEEMNRKQHREQMAPVMEEIRTREASSSSQLSPQDAHQSNRSEPPPAADSPGALTIQESPEAAHELRRSSAPPATLMPNEAAQEPQKTGVAKYAARWRARAAARKK
mmetsp:Transcript_146836/g.258788  ORF Transcript_146836/g.258788 Transcript_146836/m.258788 type:complete len:404 (-) Transcript_146836:12-1223(-)